MATRVLIVDDEPRYLRLLEANLRTEGYEVVTAQDGQQALDVFSSQPIDLALLDIMMPRLDGFGATQRIREFSSVPIIILTAKGEEQDRVRGLDLGADDYLTKPFALAELAARVRALLRRRAGRADPLLTRGDLSLNPVTKEATFRDASVTLSAREFALLWALAEGRVLSRAQLEERVYGWDEEVDSNAVEVHIYNLRRKLGGDVIRNLRGVGYYIPDRQ